MLVNELERQGNWLFRRRSFVPLLLLPFALIVVSARDKYTGSSSPIGFWFDLTCFGVSLAGLIVRALAQGYAQAGSSGRNTRGQIADSLNTSGMYSICRHPLYLGNLIMAVGVLAFTKSLWFAVSGLLGYLLLYERIIAAEERFIADRFGDVYSAWAERTPALLPRFALWKQPALPFSWRAAVKGEFYGLTATIAVLFILDTVEVWSAERQFHVRSFWPVSFAVSMIGFLVLRHLRKHTRFFEETGRLEQSSG